MYATVFHYKLFYILIIIAIPGLLMYIPKLVKQLGDNTGKVFLFGNKSYATVAIVAQAMLAVCIFTMAGVWLSAAINSRFVFFEAIAQGRLIAESLRYQIGPALLYGGIVGLLFVAIYYFIIRPGLSSNNRRALELFRKKIPVYSRLAFEPIFDEIVFRWGVQSILTWVAVQFFAVSDATMWVAITLTALFYGAAHLPVYRAAGADTTQLKISATIIALYLLPSLAFGALFWKVGLASAILGHMVFAGIVKTADTYVKT